MNQKITSLEQAFLFNAAVQVTFHNVHNPDLHGWNSQNESDKDAHWKIRIKPVKLTNLSMTQALFDP